MLLQHPVQVGNSVPVPAADNHNEVATEREQSWESEYLVVKFEMELCCCGLLHFEVSVFSISTDEQT
jgi:hypothetical protein